MSPRNRSPAQGGLWGRQQHLPADRGPGYTASNDLDLFVAVARTAIAPSYVLIGPSECVFRREPSRRGHVDPVPSYEAAMVTQLLDSGHLTTGGTPTTSPRAATTDPPAPSSCRAPTCDQIDRWTHMRPLPRPTGAAP